MPQFKPCTALPIIQLARVHAEERQYWLFRIHDYEHQNAYENEAEALLAAEHLLFTLFRDLTEEYYKKALLSGKMNLALWVSERRGYWQGREDEKKLHQIAVGNAIKTLRNLA